MSLFDKIAGSLFQQKSTDQGLQEISPYNQAWKLWLQDFTGDVSRTLAQLQHISPVLTSADAQALLAQIREETKLAMSEFYDVRDQKQSREQGTHKVAELLPNINKDNLNRLIGYCQYSVDR